MQFIEFQNTFQHDLVIPLVEIKKSFPNFDRNVLTNWQKKGYLVKIRNKFYRLAKNKLGNEFDLFFIANRINKPSYVSLHSALSWYGLIPEGVFNTTSVSTLKTEKFETPDGIFKYFHLKKSLFFGYELVEFKGKRVLLASMEKAILDFLYLHPKLNTVDDFVEMRLDIFELRDRLNLVKFDTYLQLFQSKALTKRASTFLKFLQTDVIN